MDSSARWALTTLRKSANGFALGSVVLGVLTAIASAAITTPARPDFADRAFAGLAGFVVAAVATLVLGFAALCLYAPYSQRKELRRRVAALGREQTPRSPLEAEVLAACLNLRMVAAGHVSAVDFGGKPLWEVVYTMYIGKIFRGLQEWGPTGLEQELNRDRDSLPLGSEDNTEALQAYISARLAELEGPILKRLRRDG